jgi:hypothetical protein
LHFFQFYLDSAGKVEAIGDRQVLVVDGRLNKYTLEHMGNEWGRKHGYKSFKLFGGPQFTRARAIGELKEVHD